MKNVLIDIYGVCCCKDIYRKPIHIKADTMADNFQHILPRTSSVVVAKKGLPLLTDWGNWHIAAIM
jgi:hypothetical protein